MRLIIAQARNEKALHSKCFLFLVAGMGFEPHDLRVMSPTSYQAAPPRDMVPEAGIEPVRDCSHGILSPGRLPIPPFRHVSDLSCLPIIASLRYFVNPFTEVFSPFAAFHYYSIDFPSFLCYNAKGFFHRQTHQSGEHFRAPQQDTTRRRRELFVRIGHPCRF